MTTSNNKKSGLGCISVLLALGLVAAGAYYFRGKLIGKELTPLEAAQAVPEEALFTGFVTTEPQDWSQLSKFGTPEAQKVFNQGLDSFKKELTKGEINYEQDIKPWIGGVMLAFLPSQSNEDYQMLMVVGIKNRFKASDFEKKLEKQADQTITKDQYKGVTIKNITYKDNSVSSFAVVGNHLLFSDNQETIKTAIDTLKGGPSFAEKTGATQILSGSLTLNNPVFQLYLADYANVVEKGLLDASPDTPISPETLKQLKQVDSMVLGVGIEKEGIRAQAIANLNPSTPEYPVKSAPGKVLNLFPGDTFALVSGQGINEGWSYLVKQSETNQELKSAVTQIRQGLQFVNLDADKEIFGWMDGEFAIGGIFSNQSSIPGAGIGGMIVLETSAQKNAQDALDKINQIVKINGVDVQSNQVDGKNITEWKSPQKDLLLSYGWLNDKFLAMTVVMPFNVASGVKSGNSLAQSQNFKTVTGSLPKNNLGYFYIDMNRSVNEITKIAQAQGASPEAEVMAVLKSIEGLAVTMTMPNKNTSQLDMLLALKSSK